jgi:hypothetical protein
LGFGWCVGAGDLGAGLSKGPESDKHAEDMERHAADSDSDAADRERVAERNGFLVTTAPERGGLAAVPFTWTLGSAGRRALRALGFGLTPALVFGVVGPGSFCLFVLVWRVTLPAFAFLVLGMVGLARAEPSHGHTTRGKGEDKIHEEYLQVYRAAHVVFRVLWGCAEVSEGGGEGYRAMLRLGSLK